MPVYKVNYKNSVQKTTGFNPNPEDKTKQKSHMCSAGPHLFFFCFLLLNANQMS
jgi:hypothetical protein